MALIQFEKSERPSAASITCLSVRAAGMQVASLQELCLDKIDIHLDRIPSFASLPADIVQRILSHLISLRFVSGLSKSANLIGSSHRKLGSRSLTDETAGKFFVPHLAELNLDCVWISTHLLRGAPQKPALIEMSISPFTHLLR